MRQTIFRSAIFCYALATLLAVTLAPVAEASTRVNMKQLIVPLNCLFDEINDGSGAVVYLTPETCGTLVVPKKTDQPVVEQQSQPVPTEYFSGSTYLDSQGGRLNKGDGFMLVVRPGMVYSFRLPGDSPVGPPRTLEINRIQDGTVTITFGPGDRKAILREGQRISANIAYDSSADIEVAVLRVDDDGSAIIHIGFPLQPRLAGRVVETNHTMVAFMILVCMLGATVYVHAHTRYRSRGRSDSHGYWKIEETIK